MIQRIGASTLNFKANEISSARDGYSAKVDSNLKIVQNQNNIVSKVVPNISNSQIAMQGNNSQRVANSGQKINIVA